MIRQSTAIVIFLFSAIFFLSCTNSDDYIFNENDATPIFVSAYMTSAFDPSESQVKADTISPADSIIFVANVSPSKSIRTKKYYWTIDGDFMASEFSFRGSVDSPGRHEVVFVLIDYFGDTLSDTLHLWVQSPPIINSTNVIPANQSNGMPTHGGVHFAWTAYDPDSTYELLYRFTLKKTSSSNSEEVIVDTTLNTSYFSYWGSLDMFTQYTWQVNIKNEMYTNTEELFSNKFYTGGSSKESALMGSVKGHTLDLQAFEDSLLYIVQIQDSLNNVVASDSGKEICKKYFKYRFSPIKPGTYTLQISSPSHPEYAPFKQRINLAPNEVLDISETELVDSIAPSIKFIGASTTDTILFADTLYFEVQDNGHPISGNFLEVGINGKPTDLYSTSNDTLMVFLPKSKVIQLLSIKVKDLASNKSARTFIVEAKHDE
ncbi:hypothetical protein [Fibrobacter sp.]|uniref:hypothetical protein n=1 Tax=Fibrobacter sp. TaxID=35828 RepID=UPI00388D9B6F